MRFFKNNMPTRFKPLNHDASLFLKTYASNRARSPAAEASGTCVARLSKLGKQPPPCPPCHAVLATGIVGRGAVFVHEIPCPSRAKRDTLELGVTGSRYAQLLFKCPS